MRCWQWPPSRLQLNSQSVTRHYVINVTGEGSGSTAHVNGCDFDPNLTATGKFGHMNQLRTLIENSADRVLPEAQEGKGRVNAVAALE